MVGRTGNLFIETAECSVPGQKMHGAGIYHEGCPQTFVIGNYETIWLFDVDALRYEHSRKVAGVYPKWSRVEKATSHGFLLPLSRAGEIYRSRIDVRLGRASFATLTRFGHTPVVFEVKG